MAAQWRTSSCQSCGQPRSTTASRGTHVVWRVARVAGPDLSGRIRAAAGSLLDRDPDDLRLAPGGIAERASNTAEIILSYAELADRLEIEGYDRFVRAAKVDA